MKNQESHAALAALRPQLLRFARLQSRPVAQAEDVVQEAISVDAWIRLRVMGR